MAESFALQDTAPVQQRDTAQLPQIRVGAAEGVGQLNGQVADTSGSDRTNELLLKLGGELLAPKVKEAAQQQFLSGVQQAQAGTALTEIVAQQPWYSQIFGPSSAAMGARAYTQQMQIAKWGADMENNMSRLAEGSPDNFLREAQDGLKQFLTGDETADFAITSTFVDQMAPLAKRHAKEHYVYQQKRAVDAQVNAWTALGDGYQARAAAAATSNDPQSKEDLKAERARFIGSIGPFADQTDDSYDRSMTLFLQAAGQKGNFQVVKMFKDEGLYDKLSPERRAALDQSLKPLARAALDQAMPTYALDLAMITRDTAQDPRGAAARFEAFNAKVAAATGVSETEMIPRSSYDSIVGGILSAQAAAANAQRTKDDAKAEDAARLAMANALLTVPGAVDSAVAIGTIKEQDRERAVATQWSQQTDPGKRAEILNASKVGLNNVAKSQLQHAVGGEDFHNGFAQAAITFDKMDPGLHERYFSAEQVKMLDRYSGLTKTGVPNDVAFVAAKKLIPMAQADQLPESEKSDLHKEIRKEVERQNENFFGSNNIDDSSMRTIETLTNRSYKQFRGPSGMAVAVARAVGQASTQGLQIVGKHAIVGQRDQRPLQAIIANGKEPFGAAVTTRAFEQIMEDQAKANGIALDDYWIVRTKDIGGDPQYVVEASGIESGKVKSARWYISGSQVREQAKKAPIDVSNVSERLKSALQNTSLPTSPDGIVN